MPDNVRRDAVSASSPAKRDPDESADDSPRVRPVRVTVDLDPATHRALKIHVAEQGTTISALVQQLVADTLGSDPA